MATKQKIILSWSGGKDCALALYESQQNGNYQITTLLTTLTEDYDRISMHGVRRILLEQQAESLGLPLEKMFISKDTSEEQYESQMRRFLEKHRAGGTSAVAFGDIFLEDLKKRRQDNLAKVNMQAIFPIWKKDTTSLANTFINNGFKAIITCVDSKVLDKKFVGASFDKKFLSQLPATIDPCGENGEFHSFVYDGPIFKNKIPVKTGQITLREDRFYFCDLMPL